MYSYYQALFPINRSLPFYWSIAKVHVKLAIISNTQPNRFSYVYINLNSTLKLLFKGK